MKENDMCLVEMNLPKPYIFDLFGRAQGAYDFAISCSVISYESYEYFYVTACHSYTPTISHLLWVYKPLPNQLRTNVRNPLRKGR